MKKNKKFTILVNMSIRDALKEMDLNNLGFLIVINNKKKVKGIFTMGDFRRSVFFGIDINSEISTILNKNFQYLSEGFSKKEAKRIFINNKLISVIPVVNKNFQLVEIINKKDFFSSKELIKNNILLNDCPIIIMAGGKGTRLDPFTRILPKPLIPFGNDPMIKVIMDYFLQFGANKFYISLNEKSSMIKAYFNDIKLLYNIKYVEEKKPLGTAGSLKLLKNKLKKTFIVANSDTLIRSHYPSIIKFHKENKNDITLILSMRNFKVPYGVCEFSENGDLKSIKEKPQYDFFVNTGLYVVEPKVLKLIPDNKKFDMNELLDKIRISAMKIGVFPISENSWIDVGQWSEYIKNSNKLNIFNQINN